MTWIPDSGMLQGVPLNYAEGYGKPHIGSGYTRDDAKAYRLLKGARCAVCGMDATNSHHFPPLSRGRHLTMRTPMGIHVLKPALIAVCGSGVTGCHGRLHSAGLSIEWVWDSDADARAWWSGEVLARIAPHSPELYGLGHWLIRDRETGAELEVGA